MNRLILILIIASVAFAPVPAPGPDDACLAASKDPQSGAAVCLYCYGYEVIPESTKCADKNMDHCIMSLQLPGFPASFCNICEKGFSLDLNNQATCAPVAAADKVENCDYYWIPGKTNQSKCMGCAKGYVAKFTDQSTLTIGCFQPDVTHKVIDNCETMVINEFKKTHKETVTVSNCQICEEGYTLYQTNKATGFLKEVTTSECVPQTGHFQGCAVHNKDYSILGELEDAYCGMCDPRAGYRAHQLIGRWKNGKMMCKKWSTN